LAQASFVQAVQIKRGRDHSLRSQQLNLTGRSADIYVSFREVPFVAAAEQRALD